jgi:hypothetical protein
MENAVSGVYPIARQLFMYTAGEPSGTAAEFLAWILSPAGQAVVSEVGFYPLPGAAAAAAAPSAAPAAVEPAPPSVATPPPAEPASAPSAPAGESAADILGGAPSGPASGTGGLHERAGS